jgi:5-formyltetrahydrofolate cyclo-ligase
MQIASARFEELVRECQTFITYVPLRTEADFASVLSVSDSVYQIRPRAALDPSDEARTAIHFAGVSRTCVLMPGRAFDASGTRLGQGGGWYDRFLAQVPDEWLRIGFCTPDRFSQEPLPHNSWDQPVDIVCVVGNTTDFYETHARLIR